MKKFALALTFAFAGAAFAQAPMTDAKPAEAKKAPAMATEKAPAMAPEKAMPMQPKSETAEVVSVAADGVTLTIKATPENKVLKVVAKAQPSVKALKAGEKVVLVLDEKGEVTEAKAAMMHPKTHKK